MTDSPDKGNKKVSDMSVILVVGAVIVLVAMSVFFGNITNRVGKADAALLGKGNSYKTTTTKNCDCPPGWSGKDCKICCPPGTKPKHLLGDAYICVMDCKKPQSSCVQTCCNKGQTCQTQPPWPAPDAIGYCFDNDENKCAPGTSACPADGKAKACCKPEEVCTKIEQYGFTIYGCSATEDGCKKDGGTLCKGGGIYTGVDLCCTGGSTCFVSPNGMPACVPPSK